MRATLKIIELIIFSTMVITWGIGGMLVWRIIKKSYSSGFRIFHLPWALMPEEMRKNLKKLWYCLSIIMAGALFLVFLEFFIRYAG